MRLPPVHRDASVRPESFDAKANTVEIVWSTGSSVRRYSWWDGEEYDEVLSMEPGAVRLDRLNAGAAFVDTHATHCLDNVIGAVVPGTAKIEDGRGIATILLSAAPGVADTVQKIREGVIRNISVGYWLHKVVKTEADDGSVARHDVVDWEPLEISAVPVPADAGSQIRSAGGDEGEAIARSSCLIVTRTPASGPSPQSRGDQSMTTRKPAKPKSQRNKTPAEIEAEKKRQAEARRAAAERAKRDEDDAEEDESERDEDEDEARDGDEGKKDDDADADDQRDGDDDDADDEDRDGDDDADESKKDDERAAGAAAKRAAEAAVKAERVRSAKITEMAERAGLPKLGRKHLDQGTSVKRFGEIVLERMLKKQEARGHETLAGTGAEEIGRDAARSGSKAAFQREVEEGAAFFRRLSGKPDPKKN
ncbi:HK97 family phage prohead protease [Methylobacterium sp. PvP109]|uniref:HK97 family phage prohead protease n=1 Tax=Methylobacterium radiotolerans TaxID=31998 RepID=A0ABV2NPZ1_9HYPH|nr:HK97 family phage prohead protease [Methylobacterium sp. PvP109]